MARSSIFPGLILESCKQWKIAVSATSTRRKSFSGSASRSASSQGFCHFGNRSALKEASFSVARESSSVAPRDTKQASPGYLFVSAHFYGNGSFKYSTSHSTSKTAGGYRPRFVSERLSLLRFWYRGSRSSRG